MTKAELEAEIRVLKAELQRLHSTLERRSLDTWIATNDPGAPVCIPADSGDFSVQVYTTENGAKALGVIVSEGSETVFATGVIPAKVVMEEIDYLRRSA